MECPSCKIALPEGSRFCLGCGAALLVACPSCGNGNSARVTFCATCGHKLGASYSGATEASTSTAAPGAPRPHSFAERRQLTVLFCDLVGSTRLASQLDPEDLREVIDAYHQSVAEIVEHLDGFVAQYMGDGVLAYFGYPQAHEDDAERAVRAGLGTIQAIGRLQTRSQSRLQVRVGISTGLVVVADRIGSEGAREHNVFGEAPNLAARLQALAEPNTVMIEPTTRRLVADLFECREVGAIRVKGFDRSVRVSQVLRPGAFESRFEALHSIANLTPLVGRKKDLRLLLDCWERAKIGDGNIVMLSGEAGVGKSRLVQALQEELANEHLTRFFYYCSPRHEGSALYPIVGALRRAAAIEGEDGAEAKLEKLEAWLAQSNGNLLEVVPLFASLLSIPVGKRYSLPHLTPQSLKARTFSTLLDQLKRRAAAGPVLLVFEDLQWVDPTTLEWLSVVVEAVAQLPILLLTTFRAEFKPQWQAHENASILALGRLDKFEAQSLVANVSKEKALTDDVVDQIVSRSDGVPLFIEELTKAVLEIGVLRDVDDRYVLVRPLDHSAIPATLHASLLARLDRFMSTKEVAQIGAVIGREFSYVLMAAVSGLPEPELIDALAQLVEAELVFQRGTPPDTHYLFKHALIQDAAYGTLLRSKRQTLHSRIAQALIERFSDSLETAPEVIAHHLTEAGAHAQAADQWMRAGARANERAAYAEAISHLGRGLSVLEYLPAGHERTRREAGLHLELGEAYRAKLGLTASEVCCSFKRALDLGNTLKDDSIRASAGHGYQQFLYNCGKFQASGRICEELLNEFPTSAVPLRMYLTHALGCARYMQGSLAAGRELLETGRALFRSADRPTGVDALQFDLLSAVNSPSHLARAYWLLGLVAKSAIAEADAIRNARELGQPFLLAFVLYLSLLLKALRCEYTFMKPLARELQLLLAENELPAFVPFSEFFTGCALLVEKHSADDGLSMMRQAIEAQRRAGPSNNRILLITTFAQCLHQVGDIEAGLAAVHRGFDVAEVGEVQYMRAELLRLEGEFSLASGPAGMATAELLFRNAIDVARLQGGRSLQLRATLSLGRLWSANGRREDALALLRPIYASFTGGFDTPNLKEAKSALDGGFE